MTELPETKYLHLLSHDELRALRPVLENLRENSVKVLDGWWRRYVENFGDAATLNAADFRALYARDLESIVSNLLDRDMAGFEADVMALGHELVERGVPFAEVVASMHLFEESAADSFHSSERIMMERPNIYLTFDKLSHCRMILLAGAYFAGFEAQTTVRLRELEREADQLAGGPSHRSRFHGLVGSSARMRAVYEQIAAAARGRGTVFIVGESGTGKELVARAIAECAGSNRPFVPVNCAALPRELIESELFGHKKGAYTGAADSAVGLIRGAAGGILFLDEITEMAPETQSKLLRVIEEHAVRPVGAIQEVSVDVRFVASTNRNPEAAVAARLLREDLFHRLNVHRIEIPPLRDRVEDISALVDHFAGLLSARGLRKIDMVASDALVALMGYNWPGNVRELRNAVEHAQTVGTGPVLRLEDLPPHIVAPRAPAADEDAGVVPTLEDAERSLIARALAATGGNKLQAARMLHISRHQLYDKLRKYEIHV